MDGRLTAHVQRALIHRQGIFSRDIDSIKDGCALSVGLFYIPLTISS
jgi:hypothetical protein